MHQKIKTPVSSLLLLLILSSCIFLTDGFKPNIVDDNNFLNRFPDNRKAIVLIKINGNSRSQTYWCRNALEHSQDHCFRVNADNQYHIIMVLPGVYYFLKSAKTSEPIFGKVPKSLKYLTVFEARAGEIIYVGDLGLEGLGGGDLDEVVMVKDNFNLLISLLGGKKKALFHKLFASQVWERNFLLQKYPEWQSRFKKRLVHNL